MKKKHRSLGNRKNSLHHLKNRCVGGSSADWNLLEINKEKHAMWHKLFGNIDLREVIVLLQRLERMKENGRQIQIHAGGDRDHLPDM